MAYNVDYGIQKFYTLLQQAGLARDMQMRVTAFVINGVEQLSPESLIFVKTIFNLKLNCKFLNDQAFIIRHNK